ncbi:hypothetical protein AYO21_12115 [Fonsecaea monophora]|uniref:Uncharacterized protein n=1 Tax=Fonsecaea monophora TaxID=254056 RepID=A0A177EQR4_9EURO|nr:hypothetical protein AYO21_12115 [Fonsecaea monophora]OAG33791.1 hypothetical protein AYO21_12115 [Fonsecaea monophora]
MSDLSGQQGDLGQSSKGPAKPNTNDEVNNEGHGLPFIFKASKSDVFDQGQSSKGPVKPNTIDEVNIEGRGLPFMFKAPKSDVSYPGQSSKSPVKPNTIDEVNHEAKAPKSDVSDPGQSPADTKSKSADAGPQAARLSDPFISPSKGKGKRNKGKGRATERDAGPMKVARGSFMPLPPLPSKGKGKARDAGSMNVPPRWINGAEPWVYRLASSLMDVRAYQNKVTTRTGEPSEWFHDVMNSIVDGMGEREAQRRAAEATEGVSTEEAKDNGQASGYNGEPSGFNSRPSGFDGQAPGYNGEPSGFNSRPSRFKEAEDNGDASGSEEEASG